MRLHAFLTAAALLILAPRLDAQTSWDRYLPRSLASVAASVEGDLIQAADPLSSGYLLTEADFPTRARVVYTGEWRPLTPEARELLERFVRATNLDPQVLALFREEGRFTEDGVEVWIPVQHHVREELRELERGTAITLFAMWIGAIQRGAQLRSVFVGNNFVTAGFIREIDLGTHGKVTLGAELTQRTRILGERQGDLHPLRPGTFGGAESIAVELTADHRVRAMHFGYADGTSFEQYLANSIQLLGDPAERLHNETAEGRSEIATWRDAQTIHELEQVTAPDGRVRVRLRLIDRALSGR